MSSVSKTIAREYFERHEFLVRQHRKCPGLFLALLKPE